jgi:branched-chain amino acid transport system substrate-binding protein
MRIISLLAVIGALAGIPAAHAQTPLKVGVVVSLTGPGASVGIPEKNTALLAPKTIAGLPVEYIIMDDASDTTGARKNAEKLVTEDRVDVIIGASLTPTTMAMIEVNTRTGTPLITIGPSGRDQKWVFKIPYSEAFFSEAMADHMRANGIKRIGFIGFNDPYGSIYATELEKAVQTRGISIVASERYGRTDTSVTAQVLKILTEKPEAVFIVGSGTPAALPQATLRSRGYTGPIYQTAGVINNDYLRVGGKDVEGTIIAAGPVVVAEQLPADHPSREQGLRYRAAYEGAHGPGTTTTFGANVWDAVILLEATVPAALKGAQPGTAEFRSALRDAIETTKGLKASLGTMSFSPSNHLAYGDNPPVLITIRNGKWSLLQK